MFSNIIFCKHVCVHICLQASNNLYYTINQTFTKQQIKRFSNIHVLLFFGFRFYKLPNILIFKHKRTEYKKEKGQLSHTIKKSRADSCSRRKHLSPYSTLLTSTRNTLPKSNIQRSEKKRRLKIIDDSNTKQNQATPG